MRAIIPLALAWIAALPAHAQQIEPVVQLEMKETTTIPGQPLVLRVTVLVPTWMPKAPVFPSFELPDLMVRLPERASGPTSKDVDGESWSGVIRAYRLYPLVQGQFEFPEQVITVTYADADSSEPLTAQVTTEVVSFESQIPDGAEELDPFVAATSLTLEQQIEGEEETLTPGDALVRTLTAKIAGAPPIFLPALTQVMTFEGIATYADEPSLTESDNRGVMGGSRVERTTYVAQGGGAFDIEPVALQWYNTETGSIEVAEAPGTTITVDGPTAVSTGQESSPINKVRLGLFGLALLAFAGGCWRFAPITKAWWNKQRRKYLVSERFAYRQVLAAIRKRDFPQTLAAVRCWSDRLPPARDEEDASLERVLAGLGRQRYGKEDRSDDAARWHDLAQALVAVRGERLTKGRAQLGFSVLPPLNPLLTADRR